MRPQMAARALPDFSRRAHEAEWMDDEAVGFETFEGCLRDLAKANAVTMTHRPTLAFLARLDQAGLWPKDRPLVIVDVGSGYGDGLRRIARWAARRGLAARLIGIDRNPFAARAAGAASDSAPAIAWTTCDAFDYDGPADVILSSLFTHHLDDAQLVRFLAWMDRRAAVGWFVNDLERHPLSWAGFALLARVARWHPFVGHDGPVSIRRAFRPPDWRGYLEAAGVAGAEVRARFPFRLCVSKVAGV
ncbi:MAG TPA: methyltransferase domain-containing protein [Caulobacteraceae bacterium]|nr:methyltransferase domain-containing protein [Caulobacteraceae bacterium]